MCVHNAGRSQMAAAFCERLAKPRVRVLSAGSEPASEIRPTVRQVMREAGVELSGAPRRLSNEAVVAADVVITMGCGDACPLVPGKRYLDWQVAHPAGQPLEVVRAIRDDIRARVEQLLAEMGSAHEVNVAR